MNVYVCVYERVYKCVRLPVHLHQLGCICG